MGPLPPCFEANNFSKRMRSLEGLWKRARPRASRGEEDCDEEAGAADADAPAQPGLGGRRLAALSVDARAGMVNCDYVSCVPSQFCASDHPLLPSLQIEGQHLVAQLALLSGLLPLDWADGT